MSGSICRRMADSDSKFGPRPPRQPARPGPPFRANFFLTPKIPKPNGKQMATSCTRLPAVATGSSRVGLIVGHKKVLVGGGARRARGEISGTGPEGVPARRETIFAAILKGDQQLHMFRPHPPPSSGRPPPPRSLAFQGSMYRPLGPGTPPRRHSEGAAKRGRQRGGLAPSNSTV